MNHDQWTDQLSSYLDDDLDRGARLDLERHLLDCTQCQRTIDELRAVVAAAQSLAPREPAGNLWPAIAAGIDQRVPVRHLRVPLVGAIAAGVLLAITSSMTAWLILHPPVPVAEQAAVEVPPVVRPVSAATVPYGHAVDDLMSALDSRRDQLSPRTVQVLERSLATIDQAIADAVAVLREHPEDLALVQRVSEQRRMKLAVLRQVERLTAVQGQ